MATWQACGSYPKSDILTYMCLTCVCLVVSCSTNWMSIRGQRAPPSCSSMHPLSQQVSCLCCCLSRSMISLCHRSRCNASGSAVGFEDDAWQSAGNWNLKFVRQGMAGLDSMPLKLRCNQLRCSQCQACDMAYLQVEERQRKSYLEWQEQQRQQVGSGHSLFPRTLLVKRFAF